MCHFMVTFIHSFSNRGALLSYFLFSQESLQVDSYPKRSVSPLVSLVGTVFILLQVFIGCPSLLILFLYGAKYSLSHTVRIVPSVKNINQDQCIQLVSEGAA